MPSGAAPMTSDISGELSMCPICYGHTKLLGNNVFCPQCNIIVSENVSDALKTKVELIKQQVVATKVAPEMKQAARRKMASIIIELMLLVILFIVAVLGGITGYDIVRGMAYEKNGEYDKAHEAYEGSQWLFPLPGITAALDRTNTLAASEKNYERGQQAFKDQQWEEAILYYSLVARQDANYKRAQIAKTLAEEKLQESND